MRRLIEIATERRVTIVMFAVAILLFGMVSLSRLSVNLLPELSYPTLTIRAELPGAAPVEVENLLTKPIEEAVGVIRNVRTVRSVSRSGQTDVTLEFVWGTDMDIAGVDVREKVDIIELPLEASRPLLLRFDPASEPIMRIGLLDNTGRSANADPAATEAGLKGLRRLAEERIKADLEAEEGTAAVKVSGGLEDEIQIQVDQQRLAQLGISIEQVAARIRAENVNLSGGRLEEGSQRFLVRTINEFRTVEEFADAIVANVAGRPVYLRDIATVNRGYKEREAITRVNGVESVELAVYKEGDANTVQVARRVDARLETLGESLPENLELTKIYDQSNFISAAISQVSSAGLIGGLLAIMVLYGFLRDSRATAIIAIAIPVSVVGTFLLMYTNDVSLNIMSLGGIALAVGMLVDNAIVVLENIVRKKEQGLGILASAREGTAEVSSAVVAATLTTIAVFFPMVFISGIAGQLFRDQALTVTFALVFSLVVALTLIPMLAALGTGSRYAVSGEVEAGPPGRLTRAFARILTALRYLFLQVRRLFAALLWPAGWLLQRTYAMAARIYEPLLDWSLCNRYVVVAAAVSVFGLSMLLVPRLGTELIPQLSQGEFNLDLRLSPGAPLDETDRAIQQAQAVTASLDAVDLDFSVAGTGNRLDANPVDAGENTGSLSITLIPGMGRADEDRVMDELRGKLDTLPGVQYEFRRPALMSFAAPLQIEIAGFDLDALQMASESIVERLNASTRFTDVRSTVETGNPEIQIVFDQERAAMLGLAVRDIADRVVANVRGEVATRYTWRDRKIDVLVRSVDNRHSSIEDVRKLIVNPNSDRPVTLESVAEVFVARGPAEIRRVAQERVALLTANLAFGDLGAAVAEARSIIAETVMPSSVVAMVSGQNEEMQDSFRSMQFALALAVFLVYLVMASQFESLIHPLVILFTIPLALVGAVWALFVTGTTINVIAFIGVIMLAGIVVNNAIVLVDLVNQLRAAGMEKTAAIREAGRTRLRPILMTTMTTALGLLPMAIGIGEGSEVRTPMAITVIGGLLVSTLLTLVVIPVVYSIMDRKRWPQQGTETLAAVGA